MSILRCRFAKAWTHVTTCIARIFIIPICSRPNSWVSFLKRPFHDLHTAISCSTAPEESKLSNVCSFILKELLSTRNGKGDTFPVVIFPSLAARLALRDSLQAMTAIRSVRHQVRHRRALGFRQEIYWSWCGYCCRLLLLLSVANQFTSFVEVEIRGSSRRLPVVSGRDSFGHAWWHYIFWMVWVQNFLRNSFNL